MKQANYISLRQTALSIATAVAISVPETGIVGEITPILKELNLKKQLQNNNFMRQYRSSGKSHTSGKQGHTSECIKYRTELKGVISDFLSIITIVPGLSSDNSLIENLESALTLVDNIPDQTTFLIWKTLGNQLEYIRTAVNKYEQDMTIIPPLDNFTVFNTSTNSYEMDNSKRPANQINEDVDALSLFDRSFVDLFRVRLDMYACRLNSLVDLTPDAKIDAEDAGYAGLVLSRSDHANSPQQHLAMAL